LLRNLGVLAGAQGRGALAAAYLDESLALARGLGHPHLICAILLDQGELALARQQPDAAARVYDEALGLARGLGSRDLQALALYGLARGAAAIGDLPAACGQGQASETLLTAVGHLRAAEVAGWAASLPCPAPAPEAPPGE